MSCIAPQEEGTARPADESATRESEAIDGVNSLSLNDDLTSEEKGAAPPVPVASPDPIAPPPSQTHLSSSTSIPPSATMTDSTSHKPLSRRSSQFHSSRPAPPSPAPSRRTSQIHSPALSSRDRASSTSSSAGHLSNAPSTSGAPALGSGSAGGLGRKLSQSQGAGLTGRNSISKNRPRSSLGTAMYTGGTNEDGAGGIGEREKKERPAQSHSAPSPRLSQSASLIQGAETLSKSTRSVTSKTSATFSAADTPTESETPNSSISPTNTSPTKAPSQKPSSGTVVVRDYGYPSSDERYHGRGQPIPAAESSSSARLSSFLASSASPAERRSPSMSENKRDKEKGWSFSMLSWRGFIGRSSRSNSRSEGVAGGGEAGALGQSGRSLDAESEPDLLVSGSGGAEDDYAFESSSEDDEEPFGLYRAAYPFEAEGEHEISLDEGEVVEVKGRGGGEGWVIAVKLKRAGQDAPADEGGGGGGEGPRDMVEGLVPEGYLEKVDEEELRSGMIHAGFQGGQRHPVAPGGISEEPEETSDLETGAGR